MSSVAGNWCLKMNGNGWKEQRDMVYITYGTLYMVYGYMVYGYMVYDRYGI